MNVKSLSRAACAAAVLSLAVPAAASAGWQYETAACIRNSDGSGTCYGTFRGFRNSSGSGDYATFVTNGSYMAFYGAWGSVTASCVPNSTVSPLWNVALGANGYFYIEWNNLGYCTYLSLNNSSGYTNY